MTWPTNYVSLENDYRYPATSEGLLGSRPCRVMLLGTSRMGKTTLLNRIKESVPGVRYFDLRYDASRILQEVKAGGGLLLLDEAQVLYPPPGVEEASLRAQGFWTRGEVGELAEEFHRRGEQEFILAGWPRLESEDAPEELKRLRENVRDTQWLLPLTEQQTASMVRREKSQAPQPCGDEVVRAIYRATGGFPNLIAGLCKHLTLEGRPLRVPSEQDLDEVIEYFLDHGDPLRLFYESLTPRLQRCLEEHQLGVEGALRALRWYGVVADGGSRFKGELFDKVWGVGGCWKPRHLVGATGGGRPGAAAPRPTGAGEQPSTGSRAQRLRILTVATEWASGHGGLSTFNRELCLAMARVGHEVYCYVPAAGEAERKHSRQHGVDLVVAPDLGEERERLHRKPPLPAGVVPDVIIGHGRVTGSAALSLMDYFPGSRRVHFLHMAPEQIEWFKDHADGKGAMQKTDERKRMEVDLAKSARLVAAVGSRLQREFARLLRPYGCKVHTFIPGLGDVAQADPPLGEDFQILLLGRAEDPTLKGLDIAARAVAQASRSLKRRLILVVRGVPADKGDELRDHLYKIAGSRNFNLLPRPYSPDKMEIQVDIQQSSLVLMPSRSEGFGLAGLEAISAGVPILLSQESGLAELIGGISKEMADCHVVPTPEELKRAAPVWSRRIDFILRDREAAFGRVRKLRELLLKEISWDKSVASLLGELLHEEEVASNM